MANILKNLFGSEEEDYDGVSNESYDETSDDGQKVIPIKKQNELKRAIMSQSKIIVIEPRIYSDATDIVDKLNNNFAVVVNFDRIEAEQAKRIIDFLSGATWAIKGSTQKVSPQIYLCTPRNFEVEGGSTGERGDI